MQIRIIDFARLREQHEEQKLRRLHPAPAIPVEQADAQTYGIPAYMRTELGVSLGRKMMVQAW